MNRRSLLGGFAAIGTTGAARSSGQHPDAALIALCAKFEVLEVEWRRIVEACPDEDIPEKPAAYHDTVQRIGWANATTPAGIAAKARALCAYFHPDFPMQGDLMGEVFASMLTDARRIAA